MHGMFKANGGCGYVKKPDFLLKSDPDEVFDPKKNLPVKITLKVGPLCHEDSTDSRAHAADLYVSSSLE